MIAGGSLADGSPPRTSTRSIRGRSRSSRSASFPRRRRTLPPPPRDEVIVVGGRERRPRAPRRDRRDRPGDRASATPERSIRRAATSPPSRSAADRRRRRPDGRPGATLGSLAPSRDARRQSHATNVYAARRRERAAAPSPPGARPRLRPNSESNTVDVIDPRTFKVVDHFAVGALPAARHAVVGPQDAVRRQRPSATA